MRSIPGEGSLPLMNIRKDRPSSARTDEDLHGVQWFEACFEQYWPSIYRMLAHMLGDPTEAEDLALETFYRLYVKHPQLDGGFNTGGWLYRVATNLGLQSIRAYRRRERYEEAAGRLTVEERPEDRPAEILAQREQERLVRAALSRMDVRQAQLLILRHSGMAYKEIAAALGLSPTSIGPLLLRAERTFETRYRALAQEEP